MNAFQLEADRVFESGLRGFVAKLGDANHAALSRLAWPLWPYVGDRYGQGSARLVFVGKASYEWGGQLSSGSDSQEMAGWLRDGGEAARLRDCTYHFMDHRVRPYYRREDCPDPYHSVFWAKMRTMAERVLQLPPHEDPFRHVAWLNVFAVGGTKGNPDAGERDLQRKDLRILGPLLSVLDPRAVVFVTGHAYDDHVHTMLETPAGIFAEDEPVCTRTIGKAFAIRTRHFQGMTNVDFKRMVGLVEEGVGLTA